MRYAGIDIASETHVIAVIGARGEIECKATSFAEDATGYQTALRVLGPPGEVLIAMEATGHYWKNLFATLAVAGHAVALLNPLRTHRVAGEELTRTKTDAIDALRIARFAAQKHPAPTPLPDSATEELRARGKLPKVALVACMHKLLLAIYSVAKHRRPFVAKLVSQTTSA